MITNNDLGLLVWLLYVLATLVGIRACFRDDGFAFFVAVNLVLVGMIITAIPKCL